METNRIKTILVQFTVYFFILLFIYAAISKLMDFSKFQTQLEQVFPSHNYAAIISYTIIILELLIAGLLCYRRTRKTGLVFSLILMIAFTCYIFVILNFKEHIPCSCGGILEKMGWTEHLYFNIASVILASGALLVINKNNLKSY